MNKQSLYARKYEPYEAARASYEESLSSMQSWIEPRFTTYLGYARSVLHKHNVGRVYADKDWPSAYDWAKPGARNHKIIAFHAKSFTVRYDVGSESHEFIFPLSWLSLSTWDFNRGVREALRSQRLRRQAEARAQAGEKARAARAELSELKTRLKAKQDELARYEKEASA